MNGTLEKITAVPEAGLIISLAGASVPAGNCFGGSVCGWFSGGRSFTVGNTAKEALWSVASAPADFAVTIRAFLKRLAVSCRRAVRRTLRLRMKVRPAVMASTLRMRC